MMNTRREDVDKLYVEAGRRIYILRTEHNWSREKLAELINCSTKFVYEIESGKKGFSSKTLLLLSKALNVSCDFILLGENM